MNRPRFHLWCLLGIAIAPTGALHAGDEYVREPRDLPTEVRRVFAAKCAGCHGSDLAQPKGRFGYVLDLARVAANREMVVPSHLSESELWVMVERGEMPPADAPTGALSAQQKEVIHAWIATGAPSAPLRPAQPNPDRLSAEVATAPTAGRLFGWIGKLHVVFVHFPIALLVAAAVGECWSLVGSSRVPWAPVHFCILFGTCSAAVTAALGWLHASGGHGAGVPHLLDLHGWLGTAVAVWAVVTAASSTWDVRRGIRSWYTRGLVLGGVLLVGLVAHFGGLLVHGEDFFAW